MDCAGIGWPCRHAGLKLTPWCLRRDHVDTASGIRLVLLGEPVGWTLVLGGICVLAGIALGNGRIPWRRAPATGAAP